MPVLCFTQLGSRKAQHIAHNNKISLHFPWHPLERQVHITGVAEKLTAMENMKYFMSRPKESQIAAIASHQSSRISARGVLEGKYLELKQKFANGEIPVPSFWAVTASNRKVWSFGRVVNIVCMIASCIRGKMTIGQSIDWRHKPINQLDVVAYWATTSTFWGSCDRSAQRKVAF